jgi:hypothetical protein
MRDIRQDLRERLNAVITQQTKHQEAIASLENQRQLLADLLKDEQVRWEQSGQSQRELDLDGHQNGHQALELPELVGDIMSTDEKWYASQSATVATKRGYNFGDRRPGRAVHFTLLGMARRGEVENVGFGRWKKVTSK